MDMSPGTIIDLLRFARENQVKQFVISGGEASIHPAFDFLADQIGSEKEAVEVVVQSNGAIGDKRISVLRNFDAVHLSIEPEATGVRDNNVRRTIDLAKSLLADHVYTYLFMTAHARNMNMIDDMVRQANEARVDLGINICVPNSCGSLKIPPAGYRPLIEKLCDLSAAKKILRFSSPFASVYKGRFSETFIGNRGGCTAGIAVCVVLPDGTVTPCPFFRVAAGNIHTETLEKIWLDSAIFKQLRNRSLFQEPCGSCKYLSYCGGCRARAYFSTDSFIGRDPDCILSGKTDSTVSNHE